MPTPITFTITTVGRAAALDAFNNGLTIALTEIAIGDDSYTPTGSETALSNELDRFNLSGGTVESLSATLRFSAAITATVHTKVFEIGLFTSTGVLFAVASTTSTTVPLTVAEANIDTICAFGLVLGDVPASSLTITLDPSAPLAIQLVNQHVGASNPHPQYAKNVDLLAEIETRTAEILALSNDLDDEVFAREAADEALAMAVAGKAALAGSVSQIFNAANGVSGKNVVNFEQLALVAGAIPAATPDATTLVKGKAKLADQSAVDTGVGADSIVTPELLRHLFSFNGTTNGHIRLPSFMGGFTLQWGIKTYGELPAGVVTVSDNFDITNDTTYWAGAFPYNANLSGEMAFLVTTRGFTASNITVDMVELSGSGHQFEAAFAWVAIGIKV